MTTLVPPAPSPLFTPPKLDFVKHRQHFEPEEWKRYFDGVEPLPNFEELPLQDVAGVFIGFYGSLKDGYAKTDMDPRRSWNRALYALRHGQFRGWDGTGYVMIATGYANQVTAGRFALCKHQSVVDPGSDHRRGLNYSHCTICGLDTSVDSSD